MKMNKKQLEYYYKLLINEKDKILKSIVNIEKNNSLSNNELSLYSSNSKDFENNYEREIAFEISKKEQEILYQINNALRKINDGSYGICELSNVSISKKRLKVIPWTPYCKNAAELIEIKKLKHN